MEEIWKDIVFEEYGVVYDYRGLYMVSNLGRVKSFWYGKEKILKPGVNGKGYLYVILYKSGKTKNFRVHRLVGFMFVDGYFDGAQVDHIDTNPQNNVYTNLRWVTQKENSNNELTRKHNSEANKGKYAGKNNPNLGKLIAQVNKQSGKVIAVKYNFEFVEMGFNAGNIYSCCTGRRSSHKGYIFRYATQEEIEQYMND